MTTFTLSASGYLGSLASVANGDTIIVNAGITLWVDKTWTGLLNVGVGSILQIVNGNAVLTPSQGSSFPAGSFKIIGGPRGVEVNSYTSDTKANKGLGSIG